MPPRIAVRWLLIAGALASFTDSACRAQDDPKPKPKADRAFDDLLASAKKAPGKADWTALRHAFAATDRYQPYNVDWRKELGAVRDLAQKGEDQAAVTALETLMDREGWMRLDAHGLAAVLYDRTGQADKKALHQAFAEGIASTLFVPGRGTTIEKPIEVLFIDEEYLFLDSLKLARKRQSLRMAEGHWIDVMEAEPRQGAGEPQTFFFNIDLPHGALDQMVQKMLKKKADK